MVSPRVTNQWDEALETPHPYLSMDSGPHKNNITKSLKGLTDLFHTCQPCSHITFLHHFTHLNLHPTPIQKHPSPISQHSKQAGMCNTVSVIRA